MSSSRWSVQESMYEAQTVSKPSWMGYPETSLCTSEWQVCYHMTVIGHCVRIVTSCVRSADTIEVDWSSIDPVRTKWVEVWDRCGSNSYQVRTGLKIHLPLNCFDPSGSVANLYCISYMECLSVVYVMLYIVIDNDACFSPHCRINWRQIRGGLVTPSF